MIINDSNENNNFRSGIKEINIIHASKFPEFSLHGKKITKNKNTGCVAKKYKFSTEGSYFIYYVFENGITDMSYMFSNCSNLQLVFLAYLNSSKVTTMVYMFNKCTNITSLNLGNFDFFSTRSVVDMSFLCN
jgi:surface protein